MTRLPLFWSVAEPLERFERFERFELFKLFERLCSARSLRKLTSTSPSLKPLSQGERASPLASYHTAPLASLQEVSP